VALLDVTEMPRRELVTPAELLAQAEAIGCDEVVF
jgi:hypothetical protein